LKKWNVFGFRPAQGLVAIDVATGAAEPFLETYSRRDAEVREFAKFIELCNKRGAGKAIVKRLASLVTKTSKTVRLSSPARHVLDFVLTSRLINACSATGYPLPEGLWEHFCEVCNEISSLSKAGMDLPAVKEYGRKSSKIQVVMTSWLNRVDDVIGAGAG
jgi:hypothetical protein